LPGNSVTDSPLRLWLDQNYYKIALAFLPWLLGDETENVLTRVLIVVLRSIFLPDQRLKGSTFPPFSLQGKSRSFI
jgi:hypothetical protein